MIANLASLQNSLKKTLMSGFSLIKKNFHLNGVYVFFKGGFIFVVVDFLNIEEMLT
jgi:hypothetical protein